MHLGDVLHADEGREIPSGGNGERQGTWEVIPFSIMLQCFAAPAVRSGSSVQTVQIEIKQKRSKPSLNLSRLTYICLHIARAHHQYKAHKNSRVFFLASSEQDR